MAKKKHKIDIYEQLSRYYDYDWGRYAGQYVEMLLDCLASRKIKPAKILDLACGTGNLALELADKGHVVHGMDMSPAMIDIARFKTVGMPNVFFELNDMTRFSVSETYDLVTCTFDSINYIRNITALKRMLKRVRESLRPGGRFVFDSNTPRIYEQHHNGVIERMIDGDMIIQKLYYDPDRALARTVFEFSDGSIEEHRQRPYDLFDLQPLLERAGMRVVEASSKFDGTAFTPESLRLICVAECP